MRTVKPIDLMKWPCPHSGGIMAGKGGFGFRIREQREKGKS